MRGVLKKTCRFRRYQKLKSLRFNKTVFLRKSLFSFVVVACANFFVAFLHTRFPLAVSIKGLETPYSLLLFPITQNGQRKEQLLGKQNQISLSFSSRLP